MDQIERPWSPQEDEMLLNLFWIHGPDWSLIGKHIPGRSYQPCRIRWLSLQETFTPEEDEMLQNLIKKHGCNFSLISKSIPGKSGQSCALRWLSLQWSFTPEEDKMLQNLVEKHGRNWKLIGKSMLGRSAKSCELRWDTFQNSMTNEDITTGALITPPSFSDVGRGQESSYINDGNLSHEVGSVCKSAPSISYMARVNMSLGGTHAYSRNEPAPCWNALSKRDLSPMMIESHDNVQEFPSDEFEPMMIKSHNVQEIPSAEFEPMMIESDNVEEIPPDESNWEIFFGEDGDY